MIARLLGRRLVAATILAVIVPIGWLIIEYLRGISPLVSLRENVSLYWYMLVSATALMSVLSYHRYRIERDLRQLSIVDPLTGLYNRRYFLSRLGDEFLLYARQPRAISLIFIDLDHFKLINDRYGHQSGDAVLIAVANVLRLSSRSEEVVARLGGEEICILLADCDQVQAKAAANRFHRAINGMTALSVDSDVIAVTASLGVATTNAQITSEKLLFKAADVAMYQAKQAGRNRVVIAGVA
jgi:diguanylate cyclase (GGDEF)-like protein